VPNYTVPCWYAVVESNPTADEEGAKNGQRMASTGLLLTRDRSKFIVLKSCLSNESDAFLELLAICLLCDQFPQKEPPPPNAQLGTIIHNAREIPAAPRCANHDEIRKSAQGTVRFQGLRDLLLPQDNTNANSSTDLAIVPGMEILKIWSVGLEPSDLLNLSRSPSFCDEL
jgi:hypothetical protein